MEWVVNKTAQVRPLGSEERRLAKKVKRCVGSEAKMKAMEEKGKKGKEGKEEGKCQDKRKRKKNYVKLERPIDGSAGVSFCLVLFLARNAAK